MCPLARSCFGLPVSTGRQSLDNEMIDEDSSMWQSAHALLHFNVDVAIVYQRDKIVLGDDLEGGKFDGDA
jgi:hypothetical protein